MFDANKLFQNKHLLHRHIMLTKSDCSQSLLLVLYSPIPLYYHL